MNHPSPLPKSMRSMDPDGGFADKFGSLTRDTGPTLVSYLKILLSRKWLVLFTTLLIVALSAVAVNLVTPIYRAGSTVLIENSKTNIISIEGVGGVPTATREFHQTQTEFIRSREVGQRVVKKLGLATNPLFDPRQRPPSRLEEWLDRWDFTRRFIPEFVPPNLTDEEAHEYVVSRFKNALSIAAVRQSQLIEIRFESPDPMLSAQIANETAEAYITADLDARFNQQQTASRWLNERLEQLGRTLEQSERTLQQYREEIGLIATPTSSMGGNVRTLDSASEKLIQARIERAQVEQIYNQVSRRATNRYEVPTVFNNPAVVSARAAVAEAERKASEAAQSLGVAHPAYKSAQADLRLAEENLKRQAEGVISSIAKQYEVARNTERQLEATVASSRGSIQDINRKEGRLNVLERDVATNKQVYETFLSRVKETDATADFRNPVARIVDQAVPPLAPIKPPKLQLIGISALVGLVLAALLALAIEARVTVIRSVDDVSQKFGVPLIVAVPKVDRKTAQRLSRLQHEEPLSLFAEANRSALTGIKLSLMHVRHPIVGVTSSLPNEGKSTVALSLAVEHARTRKTLLIDADLRNPSVARLLSAPPEHFGLSELVRGAPLEHCLLDAPEFGLSILFAGQPTKNAQDLLVSPRFAEIIADLQTRFEMIIIDTPPLELISDALPIGLRCDGMVYVVKSGETPIPLARRGIARLLAARVNILGVLLNQHDFEKAGRYYGEHTGYGQYGKYANYGKDVTYGNAPAAEKDPAPGRSATSGKDA